MRLTLLAIGLAALIAGPAFATDSPGDLVKKLGDRSFKVRTDAAAQLVKLGSAAVPALIDGTKHRDAEVAEQCRALLPRAQALDRSEKLAVLLRDSDAPPPKGLPGLEQFLKVTGDSKPARDLYGDLIRQHEKAMVARENDPTAAGDLFYQYGEDINGRFREGLKTAKSKFAAMVVSPTEITFFFVFAADPRVNWQRRHVIYQNMLVLNTKVKAALTEGEQAPAMRKLFMNWLSYEPIDMFSQAGFELAAELKMPDFLPQAVKLINDKDAPAKTKAMSMISLLQIGSKEHIRNLTPHLTDKTEVCVANFRGNVFRTQLRDVAMGMSIQLAGERLEDYGLGDRRFGDGRGIPRCLYYYGFTDQSSRDESHAKWKAWLNKHSELWSSTEVGPAPRVIDATKKK